MELYTDGTPMIYRFQFGICDDRDVLSVYSPKFENVLLFMNQHGFVRPDMTKFIQRVENNCETEDVLRLVRFRSNANDELCSVMTTQYILDKCIEGCGSTLANKLWLSPLLVEYEKNPLMNYIITMTEKLPYTEIMDFSTRADESIPIDEGNSSITLGCNRIKRELFADNMLSDIEDDNIQTITIESYVSGFNSLL